MRWERKTLHKSGLLLSLKRGSSTCQRNLKGGDEACKGVLTHFWHGTSRDLLVSQGTAQGRSEKRQEKENSIPENEAQWNKSKKKRMG